MIIHLDPDQYRLAETGAVSGALYHGHQEHRPGDELVLRRVPGSASMLCKVVAVAHCTVETVPETMLPALGYGSMESFREDVERMHPGADEITITCWRICG